MGIGRGALGIFNDVTASMSWLSSYDSRVAPSNTSGVGCQWFFSHVNTNLNLANTLPEMGILRIT